MLKVIQVLKGLPGFWPKLSESVKIWEVHSAFSVSFSHIVSEKKLQVREKEDASKTMDAVFTQSDF